MERLMDQRWALMTLQQCRRSNPVSLLNLYFKHKRVGFPYPLPHTPFSRCTCIYMYVLKSPVFCNRENGKTSQNLGRKWKNTEFHRKHDFWCRKCQNTKNAVKSIKTKQKPIEQDSAWIKPFRINYKCFSCHMFSIQCIVGNVFNVHAWVESKLYNCFVVWFVHITEDHKIWSLEHGFGILENRKLGTFIHGHIFGKTWNKKHNMIMNSFEF